MLNKRKVFGPVGCTPEGIFPIGYKCWVVRYKARVVELWDYILISNINASELEFRNAVDGCGDCIFIWVIRF